MKKEGDRDGPDDRTYDPANRVVGHAVGLGLEVYDIDLEARDPGFHDGVVKAPGPSFEGERLNCMGHGDPCCRYKILWNRQSGADSA